MVLIRHSSQWNHSTKVVLNGQRDISAFILRFCSSTLRDHIASYVTYVACYLFTKQQRHGRVEGVGNLEMAKEAEWSEKANSHHCATGYCAR
jgi:hypothetical protein